MLSPAAHIQNQDVTLYVSGKLDLKHSSGIQSHVQVCPACKDMLVAGFIGKLAELSQKNGENTTERRTEKRIESGDNGYLQTLCPLSFDRPVVQIVDSSTAGFGLVMDASLAIGTIVQVCVGTAAIVVGEVKSCRASDNGQFRLGIRVQNTTALKHTLT